ncbi:MAG: hypothetical protein ACJ79H_04430, partial [Myxococcales bacterium]
MTGEIASAYVRIRPNTAGFRGEMESGVKGAFAGLGKIAAAAGVGYGGFKFFEASIKHASDEQRALSALEQTVKSVGASWTVHGKSLEDVLNTMEVATGTGLPDLAQAFQRIVTQTKNSETAYKDLNRAQDIAVARHMGLAQAAVILARAEGGSDTALRRLGIIIPKLTPSYDALSKKIAEAEASGAKFTAQDKLVLKAHLESAKALDARASKTRIMSEIDRRFSGQTAKFAASAAGQWARFHEEVQNVMEDIGTAMLPGLSAGAAGLREFIAEARKSGEFTDLLSGSAKTFGTVFHGMGEVAHAVGPPLGVAAKEAAAFVHAVGGGHILAIVAGYKVFGLVVGTAAKAEGLLAGASRASAGAQSAEAGSSAALTAAIEANTVALRANVAALGGEVAGLEAMTVASAETGAATKASATKFTLLGSPAVLGAIGAATAALWLLHKAEKAANAEAAANDRVATPALNAREMYAKRTAMWIERGLSAERARVKAVMDVNAAHRRSPDSIAGAEDIGGKATAINARLQKQVADVVAARHKIAALVKAAWSGALNDPAVETAAKKAGTASAEAFATGVTDAEARAIYRKAIDSVTGAELGSPLLQSFIDKIRAGAPELRDQLANSLSGAVRDAQQSVRDALESSAQNLDSIGSSIAGRITSVIDERTAVKIRAIENGLDLRIRAMQDKLDASTAKREGRSLREDIAAAGLGAMGIRHGAGESATDFQQRRLDAAKKITEANRALRDFETTQTIGALQKRSERTKENLQKEADVQKRAVARNVADLTDAFNRGTITQRQLMHGVALELRKEGVTFRESGKVLGSMFMHGFQAEVAGLGKQAGINAAAPKLPGITGLEPTLVRPMDAIRAAIVGVAEAQAQRDQHQL